MSESPARIFFYIQHLLGIGHIKRASTLARGLVAAGFDVTLVSGGMPVPGLDIGEAKFVQLAPTRAVDIYFKVLVDEQGEPIDDAWKAARAAHLRERFEAEAPQVLMTELFPFGRRQLSFELIDLLEVAHAMRPAPLVLSSVRDILVQSPKPARTEEMLERVKRYYDAVLVHGDPNLIPFEQTFPHAERIADRVFYTGYVVDRPSLEEATLEQRSEVLVSAGGGAVSEPLLYAALEARAQCVLRDRRWRFLVGHNLDPARFESLRQHASAEVIIERARPDFLSLLANAELSISQGGYNTVMEVLDAGARAVIVPYAGGLETEQTLRARLLAERGVLTVVDESDLRPDTLAGAVDRAMLAPRRSLSSLDTAGVATTARLLWHWLAHGVSPAG